MNPKILLVTVLFLSVEALGQSKNNISLVYGIASNNVDIHHVIGDFGFNPQQGLTYGLSYTRSLNPLLSFETGLLYSSGNVQLTTIGPAAGIFNQQLQMLSIPLYARVTFLKYAFFQAGFSADHMIGYSRASYTSDQSGLGLAMGIGAKYSFRQVSIFVNPFFCRHAITGRQNLIETSMKFGLGYDF